MEKIIQGIIKFQNTVRPSLLPILRKLADKAEVCTCIGLEPSRALTCAINEYSTNKEGN
jgi:hypothetical protein